MNLLKIRLKRIFYLTFGILFSIFSIAGIFEIVFSYLPPDSLVSTIIVSILSIIVCLILFFIIVFLENKIYDKKGYNSFLFGYFLMAKRNKFVYHRGLGYFVCIIQKDRITVQDQKLFYAKDVANVENRGSYEKITLRIKNQMDDEYIVRIEEIEEKKRIRRQLDEISKWDGSFDVEGKREERIKNILES